jgi:PAS domain S-box-containing protein
MAPPKLQSQFAHSTVLRYGLAASSSAIALGLALSAQRYGFRNVDAPLFLFAIVITVWYAGVGPGILAVVLSSLGFNFFFTEPHYSFYVTRSELPHYAVFTLFAFLLASFAAVRRRAEAELLQARDELEIERKRVEEALHENETYLAEAQRLSHTGSFGWKPSTGAILWSEETFRIFQYNRTTTPTVELILQRVHPEDAALAQQTIERASQEGKDFDLEHRLVMPDGSLKHLHIVARALNDESGTVEFVGAVMDVTERKRASEALLRTEAYLAEGQKLSHTGTWACNLATREMIHSSEEHRRLFGLVPERAGIPSFKEFYQRIHPDDRSPAVGDLERAMAAGTDIEAYFRVVLPEGTTRYMYGIGRPLVKPSGETGEFVGTVMDVTSSKQSEEALRRTESYLAEAQRLSHTGSGAWRVPEGDAVYLSEEWYRIYGFDSKQGLSAWNDRLPRMHPEDRAKVAEAKDRAIREKSDYEVDHRILLPDGMVKYTHTVGHPVLNASGDVVQFVCTMMDVTERKRADEKLRQSEAYLAEAQKLTHTGSWVWDVAKRCALHISEEWYCIYGFDPEEGMRTWEQRGDRIHPDDRVGQRQAIERAINEKSDYDIEYRILLPNGAVRHLHSVGHPVLDASGNLVQFVGSSTDITERRQAEEALRQARADLERISRITTMGELTASLAHEVNQPIAAAVTDADTCLRWLSRDQPDLEEAREAASRMAKDATRAADIIRRIRLLFKKGSPQRELVDINEVVREMVFLLRSEATPFSVLIQTELAEIPQVMADRVQLQQVLMNLVINAIDAMKDVNGPRELIIRSQQAEDGQVMVSTCDTGVGLPAEQAEQIFKAFFTTKPHGTGMGLSISRSIVESHGGRLWAVHNSPRGASFYFTLPSAGAAQQVA